MPSLITVRSIFLHILFIVSIGAIVWSLSISAGTVIKISTKGYEPAPLYPSPSSSSFSCSPFTENISDKTSAEEEKKKLAEQDEKLKEYDKKSYEYSATQLKSSAYSDLSINIILLLSSIAVAIITKRSLDKLNS